VLLNNISLAKDSSPYVSATQASTGNKIDAHVNSKLIQHGLQMSQQCSDSVFIRRIYLDMTGTLPEANEVREFLADKQPDKRAKLIDRLFEHESFADYWTLKWCDTLRVKAEFPINLWPNAVQAYHQWIHTALKGNMPYDQFARELLTSSGSNFRTPQVNFYRALQGKTPEAISETAALTFMGARTEKWPKEMQSGLQQAFTRLSFKGTAEWKEEIITCDFSNTMPVTVAFPDGTVSQVPVGSDPRQIFADWLISENNSWFAKCAVNRVWFWLFGRGIIQEPDDIRDDNPPSNPELLAYLEKQLIESKYDLRHIYRLILNSQTYQQSSIPASNGKEAEKYFGVYPVQRLDAEVLIDALCGITGTTEKYSSPIPEPFSFIPENERSIKLADGSITSPFLEMFGRPTRDTGRLSERNNLPTKAQALHMLNSTHVRNKITKGGEFKQLMKRSKRNKRAPYNLIYQTILSRNPTKEEIALIKDYGKTSRLNGAQAMEDLIWALVNSKEFMYRH